MWDEAAYEDAACPAACTACMRVLVCRGGLLSDWAAAVNLGYIMESSGTDHSAFLADTATLNGATCSIS